MRIERHLRYKLEMEPEEYAILQESLHVSHRQDWFDEKLAKMREQMKRGETECVHE